MITGKSIAKGALIVMAATLLSRLMGFFRQIEIAEYFGLKGAYDAYLVAYAIPSGVGMAVAAAISAGFIPVLNSYFVQNDKENAATVTNTLLNTLFAALAVLTAAGILFAPMLARMLAPGFQGDSVTLTTELIRIMFPGFVFFSLMGLASGFLNSRQHFLFPALGPAVSSLVVIASVVAFGKTMGIKGLAVGTVVGCIGQLLMQAPVMYKKGFRYKPEFALFHPGVIKVFKLAVPVLIASLVPPLMVLVERGLASRLTTGSISALDYAFRLMQLPQGLFVMAVAVPLFPALSTFAAQKDYTRLKEIMLKGVSILALIMIPASAGLIALNEPIIRLLFQRGAFEAKDTIPTAYALAFYSLALLPLAVRDVFRRGFYALQDTLTPVKITVAACVLNIALDVLLVREMGIGGIALGAAISTFTEATVLYFLINGRLKELPGISFVVFLVKLVAASLVMGIVAHYTADFVGERINLAVTRGKMLQVGISVITGLIVYFGAIIVLRVREVWEAMDIVRGFFRRLHGAR
jgi:putative peptidoglycan lipid II flippase